MKATISLLAAIPMAYAFPGMSGLMSELGKRQSDNSNLLIGDLVDRPIVDLSETGNTIRNILQGTEDPQDHSNSYSCPPAMDTRECAEDTCCIWKHIAIEMQSKMSEHGQCNDFARQAIRMGFHDAAAWSLGTGKDGGADGSLILARECYTRGDNTALRSGCDQVQEWYDRYKSHGVSMADLIQMAANVATVTCPLGPRVRSFVGRKDNHNPAPDGLLPLAEDSVDYLLSLFSNKTISASELVALVGAHSTSRQFLTDKSRSGDPQDSTPGIWDVAFYRETLLPITPARIFRFESDVGLSRDERTKHVWTGFAGPFGQIPWNRAYAKAYVRMSLLGVYNINDLTECTEAVPLPVSLLRPPFLQRPCKHGRD